MTGSLLTALLLIFGNSKGFAIKPATGPQKEEIGRILEEFKGHQDNVKLSKELVGKAEAILSLNPSDAILQEQLEKRQRELWVSGRLRDECAGRAIRRTLIAYDIVPLDSSGIPIRLKNNSVMPGYSKGKAIHWYATTDELEARKTFYKDEGPDAWKKTGAVTSYSGITTLFPSAFVDPNDLALVLYHEKVHFEQYATKGRGDATNFYEREIEAWKLEKLHAKGFGLTQKELLEHERKADGWIRHFQQENELDKLRAKASRGKWQRREPAYLAPHSEEEIAAIAERAKELDAVLAYELAEVRRARDLREEERREEAARQEKNRLETVGQESLRYLRSGAMSACRRGTVDRTFLNIPMVADRDFYCEHAPKVMSADDVCDTRVFSMVMGQLCDGPAFDPGPINDYLRRRPGLGVEPAPPVEGIGHEPELGPVEASPSPRDQAPAEPAPPPGDGVSDEEDRRDRGNRVGDGNGRARGQAGRIGRTGKWPR